MNISIYNFFENLYILIHEFNEEVVYPHLKLD